MVVLPVLVLVDGVEWFKTGAGSDRELLMVVLVLLDGVELFDTGAGSDRELLTTATFSR